MTKKGLWVVFFLILSIFPVCKVYAQSNAGFVRGNIWYSKDSLEEGDKVKIYTAIFNPDSRELSGAVTFLDNTIFLGKKNFVVGTKGVKDVSIDWTATVGTHTIFGRIDGAKFLVSAGKYEEADLTENETEKSSRTVSKKITSKTTEEIKSGLSISDIASSIENTEKFVEEKTPDYVIKPVVSTLNAVENFRQDTATLSNNKNEEIKNEIKTLDNKKTGTTIKTQTNRFLKPFKYVELFFLYLISFIFNNKFIFYGVLVLVVFFILRYILRLIF